jgi:hypothetical protein
MLKMMIRAMFFLVAVQLIPVPAPRGPVLVPSPPVQQHVQPLCTINVEYVSDLNRCTWVI